MIQTLIVVDNEQQLVEHPNFRVITFEQYLAEYPKRNEPKTRVINLCDTEHYLSRGYYCSLLAEARQHLALPSVGTVNYLRDLADDTSVSFSYSLPPELIAGLSNSEDAHCLVYFGWAENEAWKKIARQVFDKFPSPVLRLSLEHCEQGWRLSVARFAYQQLENDQREAFWQRLDRFAEKVWTRRSTKQRHRWELAILIDPEEATPPSDKDAIKRFIKAASKVGIHAETITAAQAGQISQYDALFIRETTSIDHHTYRLARKAEQEGLVVIDDPTSILRCCNKVFLHDAFSYNQVPSLKTRVAINSGETDLNNIEAEFSYPLVIKLPEGSFSKGVYKVKDREELKEKLDELFQETALVLIQEFYFTDFDWRIGVLNGRAIYACRYHMAKKHWQIYNHGAKRHSSGNFETLPTFEVPRNVLDAALKACAMIGRGLYGVDIKQKDNHVFVIEVNDNPSIDHKVEDLYLGNELYMLIMQEFANRLELRGRH
ncbi:RimK family protein [Teredinibacter waterburyi]|jgi:Glutathione synthase/Ribosomal protein S6 modification enzyme (glutaminyl transferase)|uniref:RimK family protein n=1 Tax=Teredinibacter waterburyi TaxID=1500538 RepID=UPI00165F1FDB|nr:RimK family protein [Teredinibacter waterburyi]